MGGLKLPIAKFKCLACGREEYRMSSLPFGELLKNECKCGGDMAVISSGHIPRKVRRVLEVIHRHFDVINYSITKDSITAEVDCGNTKSSFLQTYHELEASGYLVALKGKKGGYHLVVTPSRNSGKESLNIPLLLLALTSVTTLLAGFYWFRDWLGALAFSSSLMAILGAHEMGHRIAAHRNGISISNPYFIPAPTPLGTFGAFIKVRKPVPTREALVEMGFLGPLMGFLLALITSSLGFLIPVRQGIDFPLMPLIFSFTKHALNPLLLSGMLMLMITSLNLLPAGQLDGGHIIRGLTDEQTQYNLTRGIGLLLVCTGFLKPESCLWLWGFLILLFFNQPHPGPLDDTSEIPKEYLWLGLIAILMLIVGLPVPV